MRWYHYIAYFFGGAFLVNAVPHLVSGVMGQPFQSPFATPPGEGLSPAWANVLWGSANLFVAYLLLVRVGDSQLRRWRCVLVAAAGGLAMAIQLSLVFGRLHDGLWGRRESMASEGRGSCRAANPRRSGRSTARREPRPPGCGDEEEKRDSSPDISFARMPSRS